MVSLIQAIILSIIQGITEWFPVSSSGHLALFQNFFGFQNFSFDVFLHLASVLAVFFIFWKDIIEIIKINNKEKIKYLFYLFIALIPAIFVGFFLKDFIENSFSNMIFLGFFFMISGMIIYSTKFAAEKKEKINFSDSIFIGIFQAIAIFPGISRSGFTISSGLFRGIKKKEAIKFSFLLSIPIILGAFVLEAKDLILSKIDYSLLIISFIVTLIVSLFTIRILIKIIQSDKFYFFGIYNFILGIFVLILGVLK